jgi:hypothetical protein
VVEEEALKLHLEGEEEASNPEKSKYSNQQYQNDCYYYHHFQNQSDSQTL